MFGDILIPDLKVAHIKSWIETLKNSNKRINNLLTPLRHIYIEALSDEEIDRNPFDSLPGMAHLRGEEHSNYEVDPLAPTDIPILLGACEPQNANMFEFDIWAGLRPSELVALAWGDIDWNKETALIQRALVKSHYKGPKTKTGRREIKLLPLALEALKRQRVHTELMPTIEIEVQKGRQKEHQTIRPVFYNPFDNKPWVSVDQARKRAWEPAIRKSKMRHRLFKQLRHTFASIMLTAGEDPEWISKHMGHTNSVLFRKVYARFIDDMIPDAGKKAAAIYTQLLHKEENQC